MQRSDVLSQLDSDFRDKWTSDDLTLVARQQNQERWRINASFARKDLERDGEISGTDYGVWALTAKGNEVATNAASQLDLLVSDYTWDLSPGDTLSRQERMDRFGGGKQGGIESSAQTPNVFAYSDPDAGSLFGYNYDGWNSHRSVYYYTGEGQLGDQQLKQGNRALLLHADDGRKVRLFVADGYRTGTTEKIQRYVGEFAVDPSSPYVRADAPDRAGQPRSVIVFRLLPVGEVLRRGQDATAAGELEGHPVVEPESTENIPAVAIAAAIDVEAMNTDEYQKSGSPEGVGIRREGKLVERFQKHLSDLGHEFGRYRVRPPGELRTLLTDTVDFTDNILYEAKASANRDAIRMALAQLLDYSRHIPGHPKLSVLLPSMPSRDLLSLLKVHGVSCTYETAGGQFAVEQAS